MQSGFPEPLFKDLKELQRLSEKEQFVDTIVYLVFGELNIGALRQADPILGDLTVYAREAVHRVSERLYEISEMEEAASQTPQERTTRVSGAVPGDQA